MRKRNGKVWLTLGVLAALSISGGIIWAATYTGSLQTSGGGVGMGYAPSGNDRQIIWGSNLLIEAKYDDPDRWCKATAAANDENKYAWSSLYAFNVKSGSVHNWSSLYAFNVKSGSVHNEKAWVEAGPDGTAIGSYVRDGGFELKAEVRATYGGDVVVTLGD